VLRVTKQALEEVTAAHTQMAADFQAQCQSCRDSMDTVNALQSDDNQSIFHKPPSVEKPAVADKTTQKSSLELPIRRAD
jgi:hypothetical protein